MLNPFAISQRVVSIYSSHLCWHSNDFLASLRMLNHGIDAIQSNPYCICSFQYLGMSYKIRRWKFGFFANNDRLWQPNFARSTSWFCSKTESIGHSGFWFSTLTLTCDIWVARSLKLIGFYTCSRGTQDDIVWWSFALAQCSACS